MIMKPDKINDPAGTGQKIFDFWGPAKKMLGEITFLKKLFEYASEDNILGKMNLLVKSMNSSKVLSNELQEKQQV